MNEIQQLQDDYRKYIDRLYREHYTAIQNCAKCYKDFDSSFLCETHKQNAKEILKIDKR